MADTYHIDMHDRGPGCDVRRNRRAWKYDLDDLDEAMRVLRREVEPGDSIVVVEPDGYRHTITLRRR